MAMKGLHICGGHAFKPGDPPPTPYLAWQDWARIQYRAGLRQARCARCGLYKFPQELLAEAPAVCLKCARNPAD